MDAIDWISDFETARARAAERRLPLLVYLWAPG